MAHQGVDVLAVLRIQAHPHGGRDADLAARQKDGLRDARFDALAHPVDFRADVLGHQQQQEFVAAQPRHQVGAAHRTAQPPGHFHQQFVARHMAQRVVDILEQVQVQEDQRRLLPHRAHLACMVEEAPHHMGTVGQAGQQVVQCHEVGLRFGLLERTDVDFAHQQRMLARDAVATTPHRYLMPTPALGGIHFQCAGGHLFGLDSFQQYFTGWAVGDSIGQPFFQAPKRSARRRVSVQRLAVFAVQRDHHGRMQQGFHRAQRFGRARREHAHGVTLAEHGHAPIIQTVAAEVHMQGHRRSAGVQRPLFIERSPVFDEVALVLRQAPRHRVGHVRAQVPRAQLLRRRGLPDLKRRGIGPMHPGQVDVEDPDGFTDEVQRSIVRVALLQR